MGDGAALAELTDPVAAVKLTGGAAVIACGSIEQHGPHLPAGTDTFIAESLARRVAERLDAVLVPVTPLGVTPLHMAFPSTVTLDATVFAAVIRDVARSLAAHSVRFLAAINWHEGNIPALATALEEAQRTTGLRCVAVQACYVAAEMLRSSAGPLSHGGRIETMLVMADHPELVHLDRIEEIPLSEESRRRDALRRDNQFQPVVSDAREISPAGWHGDPRDATRDEGLTAMEGIVGAIAERLADGWRELGRE